METACKDINSLAEQRWIISFFPFCFYIKMQIEQFIWKEIELSMRVIAREAQHELVRCNTSVIWLEKPQGVRFMFYICHLLAVSKNHSESL